MRIFVILSLIYTIGSSQDTCGIDTQCTTPGQECINKQCVDVPPLPMAQIEPIINTCNAFDNCEEYIAECNECEYSEDTDTYECKEEDSCDIANPPIAQCKKCMDGYELLPQSTCCIVAPPSPMLTSINQQIIALFIQIDTNSVGYISQPEFMAFVATLPPNTLSAEEAVQFFDAVDADHDMLISEQELLGANKVKGRRKGRRKGGRKGKGKGKDKGKRHEPDTIPATDTSDASAMTNDNNNSPDMFGIKHAKPAETYSILSVIIIAGVVILIVMIWGSYQYTAKRKAVKELNEMEANQNISDKKGLYETVIVTEGN